MKPTTHINKAVIICRVSSKEQEDGFSLDAQKERLLGYCERNNLEVIEIFTLIESSFKGKRKEFHKALDYCKKLKYPVAVVFDAVDRAQRSFRETTILDDLIKKKKIELHFYRESMIIGENSSASDLLRWDFSVMGARSYVLNLSENVKRTVNFKLKNGEAIWEAPLGLLNTRDTNNKSTVVIDKERAPLIKKMFKEYSTGLYSISALTKEVKKWGLTSKRSGKPISKTAAHRILNNPFYYGKILCKGELYPHKHPKLISEALFQQCQEIMNSRSQKEHKTFKCTEKPFIFKGLIKCEQCGCTISCDEKIKQNGKKYRYLCCTHGKGNCQNPRINENVALAQVEEIFRQLILPPELLEGIRKDIESNINAENEYHREQIKELRKKYDKAQDKIKKIQNLLIEDAISVDEYRKMTNDAKTEQFTFEQQMQAHTQADGKFSIAIGTMVSLGNDAHKLFRECEDINIKREIVNLLLSNLKLNDGKLSYTLNTPFNTLHTFRHCNIWGEGRGSNPRQPVPQTGALPTELPSPLMQNFYRHSSSKSS